MAKLTSYLASFIAVICCYSQNDVSIFSNLVNSKWISEGKQLGGLEGKTEYEFSWGLDKKIVYAKTYTTDPQTQEFELRNEGVRAFNSETKRLEFYEFDKLGGITSGVVLVNENDIHYEYDYEGMKLRDSWIYKSKNKYQFIVGVWQEDNWTRKFHEASIERKE
ncbi:MAG: hypothetical protein AAFY41_06795 [Bacteroidota bacterium]